MSDNDVRIKLSLEGDKAVADGLAGVGDGASDADSKLGSFVSGGLKGAGVALVGLAAAGAAAGAALSGAVISSYADYEQNLGGIETMFKTSSDKMVGFADEAYKTAGLSANEYMSQVTSFSASLLQGLGGDTEAAADAANVAMVDMSDNANKFGTNIGDIQNAYQGFAKQNFTMLDNLKLGYGGTKEEMARLINDSGVMGETFKATASNLDEVSFDKIIEGIHTVQEEMGIAGTTSLEASETISGSVGMLKGSFDNLLTGLGSADADVATLAGNVITSLETVVSNVGPVIENLGSNMAALGPQMGEMLGGLTESVAAAIPGLLGAGVSMIGGLVEGISSSLPALITAIVPAVVGLVEMVSTQAPLLLSAGLEAIAALASGIAEALPTLIPLMVEGLVGLVGALIENLPLLLDAGLQLITGLGEGLIAALPVLIAALPQLITGLMDFLISAGPQITTAGLELLLGLVKAMPEITVQLISALPELIMGLITGLLEAIPQLTEAGIQLFLGLIAAIPEIIIGIVEAIPQIIEGIVNGVIEAWPALQEAGKQLFEQMIAMNGEFTETVKGAVPGIINGIVSAIGTGFSALVAVGTQLFQQIVGNIGGAISFIVGKIPQVITGIINSIKTGASAVMAAGTAILNGIVGGISGVVSNVTSAVQGVVNTISNTLRNAVSTVFTIGSNIVQGIANGIAGGADAVLNAIGGVVNGAVDWAKGLLGIKSPSRVFIEIGKHLTSGFSIGILKDSAKVKSATEKLIDLVKKSFAEIGPGIKAEQATIKKLREQQQRERIAGQKSVATLEEKIRRNISDAEAKRAKGTLTAEQLRRSRFDRAQLREQLKVAKLQAKQGKQATRQKIWDAEAEIKRLESLKKVNSTKLIADIRAQDAKLTLANKRRDAAKAALKEETKALADLKKEYDDFVSSTQGSIQSLGAVSDFMSPESMVKNLEKVESRTKQFQSTIKKLMDMGLDETTVEQLTQEFLSTGQLSQATNLLEGGPEMVKKIAELQKRVSNEGKKLGTLVGKDLFQAGIDAQAGLVKGLTSDLAKLDAAAKKLADALVAAVKKSLKIKSPSKLMASEIGKWIPAGIGEGIVDNISAATLGVAKMNTALVSEANAISSMIGSSSAVPTLTPVPASYTATVSSPSAMSASAFQESLAAFAATGTTGATVDVNTNVTMIDRDPRLVGAQIGRSIQGVLNA